VQLNSDKDGFNKLIFNGQPLIPIVDFVADCVVIANSFAEWVDAYVLHTYYVLIAFKLRLLLILVGVILLYLI
jgi:hypothetical protein